MRHAFGFFYIKKMNLGCLGLFLFSIETGREIMSTEISFMDRFKKQLQDEFLSIEENRALTTDEKANKIIWTTSALCAGIAIQPIPFADMPILTGLQVYMGYKLGKVRGYDISESGMWDIVKHIGGVIGLGFAAQQTAIGLYKIGLPGLGGFMSVPLVGGLTYGIGKALDLYVTMRAEGKTPTDEDIKKAFKMGKAEGKKVKPMDVDKKDEEK
jgi:uncharacterized protein (DUF697 family)